MCIRDRNNGLVETRSTLAEDAPNELSMYLTESTLQNSKPAKLRRYSLRMDGFVSINAPMRGGKLISKPIRFSGNKLYLNFSSSARGGIRVGFMDMTGKALAGYSLNDCPWIYGDSLRRIVEWKSDNVVTSNAGSIAGQIIKLVFELKDADLFSFKFEE